jgi:predicted aspartyl protease
VVVRARSKYGQLLLVDSEVDGIPLYVIVDTGGEITIGNATLRRLLEARRASRTDLGLITSVTGEDVNADLTLMPPIKIGTITVNNLRIAYAEMYSFKQFGLQAKPAMLLGMSTLRCFNRVSIDFPGREVRFVL